MGGWLFHHRTWLPLPLAAILLLTRPTTSPPAFLALGVALVVLAELLRLWAVRHIGAVSRTRSDRLGPLVHTGPFARVRNPLYIANIMLWVGFAFSAGLPWLAPVFAVALALEYHAIVRWEEQLLASRLGGAYEAYVARVPRWLPSVDRGTPALDVAFSWRETLFSERGTLIAIAVGYLLLSLKARL